MGAVMFLKDDDPVFGEYPDAVECAIERSVDDSIHGIYDKDDGELLALVYQQEVFTK